MNNKGLSRGLVRGERMFLITKRNRARVTGIMAKSPGSTKEELMFDVQGARERERLKPMNSFQFGEVRLQFSRQVCYSNRTITIKCVHG